MDESLSKKDIKNAINKAQFELRTDAVFYGDVRLTYIYKKTERLVAALYMVTNLLSPSEPARTRLRDRALLILSDILELTTSESPVPHAWAHGIAVRISEIVAILDITRLAGVISEMNCMVLVREYQALGAVCREYADTRSLPQGQIMFPEDFFAIPESVDTKVESGKEQNVAHVAPVRQETVHTGSDTNRDHGRVEERPAGVVRSDIDSSSSGGAERREMDRGASISGISRNTDRRQTVLNLLQIQPHITVKDAARAVPGLSEKTLQRELLAMVADGLLIKEGEKRWSTYRLRT